MKIVEQLTNLSAQLTEIQERTRREAQEVLKPGLKEFMDSHLDVEAIRWTQYTPYFNDGETCTFGVHDLEAKFVGGDEEAGDREDGFEYLWSRTPDGVDNKTWADLHALNKALSNSDDALQATFGDHVRVIVTKDGVDTEEYEHD
jgi:hypothetical protein